MQRNHDHSEMLDAAIETAQSLGLNSLSFGRVAKRLQIADRTVVYYFPTKSDLITAVLLELGNRLADVLETAIDDPNTSPPTNHLELARTSWPLVSDPAYQPVFAMFIEAIGLAASQAEPYATIVPVLLDGWIEWASTRLHAAGDRAREEATATIALIDGLLILQQISGSEAAQHAATQLGISPRG